MKNENRTHEELVQEATEMRHRITELEMSEVQYMKIVESQKKAIKEISNLFISTRSLDKIYKKVPKILSKYFKYPIVAI